MSNPTPFRIELTDGNVVELLSVDGTVSVRIHSPYGETNVEPTRLTSDVVYKLMEWTSWAIPRGQER